MGAGILAGKKWTLDEAGVRRAEVAVNEEAACRAVEEPFGIHSGRPLHSGCDPDEDDLEP